MNVLFVGAWDIAGAYIADRLLREGNEVCWMTGEGTRILWNKKFKGNIYRGIWKREDYLRILKANSVDTVIFLTGQFREHYEEVSEYESQMLDFTNLMNVLRNYPLRCLVYLSSLELDYKEIYTPLLTDLAAGEMLCEAYHKAYGMPVLILRMGCVFGSFGIHDMGYTGYILNQLSQGEKIVSQYASEDYIDIIYGEDVAVALNDMLKLNCRGLYKLTTGHPITMETFVSCLADVTEVQPKVIWESQKHTAPETFFCEENQIKEETGWIPFVLLEEKGIAKLKQALKLEEQDVRPEEHPTIIHKLKSVFANSLFRQTAETLVLFVIICILQNFSSDVADLKYVDIRLMFVTIISCRYGIRMGMLSIFLACSSYVYSLMQSRIDVSYLIGNIDSWIPFAAYFITGSVISHMVDSRDDAHEALKEKYSLLQDKYEFLKAIHGETLEIKGNLQHQIITSKHSFENAYEVAVELDSLKPELILIKVIHILENIMECDKVAVFLINHNYPRYARLKACSQNLREQLQNSLDMDRFGKIREEFQKSNVFINTDLMAEYPDYAAPIYYQEHIYGFVSIYDIGPDKFTVYYQNLFRITISLIEKNLVKALKFEDMQRDKFYYEGTELLYPAAIADRLETMEAGGEGVSHSYVKGTVYPQTPMEMSEVSRCISSVIRGSDFMGIDEYGNYIVILINMSLEHLELVKERFRRKGLILEVE